MGEVSIPVKEIFCINYLTAYVLSDEINAYRVSSSSDLTCWTSFDGRFCCSTSLVDVSEAEEATEAAFASRARFLGEDILQER